MQIRRTLGVAAGLVIASGIFLIIAMIATLFPETSPANIEYWTAQERAAYFSSMPIGGYLTTAFGCLLASFTGGWIAAVVSKERHWIFLPVVLGILLTLVGMVNALVVEVGQPAWSIALSLVMFIPFTIVGYRAAGWSPIDI